MILVKLSSYVLEAGMVTDFKHLNWFKKFLDDVLDHKFIIDKADPMFNVIVPHQAMGIPIVWNIMPEGYSVVAPEFLKNITDPNMVDILEGFVVVDFVPTSENLSAWLAGVVDKKMAPLNVKVDSLHFYETPKSSSLYTP
jgi:6-pyruvoyltetrahydropterin/6-carboxytetrahydropterin synthase